MKQALIFFMIHTKRKKEKREFIMTMKELAWLMPLLFILHDMEEIVLYSVIGMIIAMANLKLLHRHAHSFSDLIDHVFTHK